MLKGKITCYILIFNFLTFSACSQDKVTNLENQTTESKDRGQHPLGGWFCPDNFGGFPPVNIKDLANIPVVSDRLPTQEETRNGTSLMYIDKEKYPNAVAVDMNLPRLATTYSSHSDMNELIIIIQAVKLGQDTIIGFRYPTGGNGSAWIDEVRLLSDKQSNELESTPYVYLTREIKGTKEDVWKAFTKSLYAEKLGDKFKKGKFFQTDWTPDSKAHLNYNSGLTRAAGIALNMWGSIYMQIDYDNNGFHFAEKMLITEDKENNTSELHIVSGPYPEDYGIKHAVWEKWLEEVKHNAEK